MASMTAKVAIKALDQFSGPIARMATNAQRAYTKMDRGVAAQAAKSSRRFASQMGTSGNMSALAASGASAMFIKNESDLQTAMNRTQATLNVVNDSVFKPHRDLVIELAKQYPTTSAEIAKGATELAMSGMNLKQLNEVLEATVQGSMASGESIKTVGMGVTDVVMGLGKALTKENFHAINNVLAAGATSYAQDYKMFLEGLGKTAPIARMQGMSIERLTGMLGILADGGIKAAKGGTALRTSMINLAAPTAKAAGFIEQYLGKGWQQKYYKQVKEFQLKGKAGIGAIESLVSSQLSIEQPNLSQTLAPILNDKNAFKDIGKLKSRLAAALRDALDMNDSVGKQKISNLVNSYIQGGFQQVDVEGMMRALASKGFNANTEAMKELYGKRFVAAMDIIMNSMNTGAFDKKRELFLPRIEGAVKRFAAILMKGLPGALKRLGGAWDGFLRAAANSGAIDTVVGVFERLRDTVNWLSETNPALLKFATLAILTVGVLGPMGFAIAGLAAAVSGLGAIFGLAAIGLAAISWPVVLGVAAIGVVIAKWKEVSAFFRGFWAKFNTGWQNSEVGWFVNNLVKYASKLGSYIGKIIGWFGQLFGIKPSPFTISWFRVGFRVANKLLNPIRSLKEAFSALFGLISRPFTGAFDWLTSAAKDILILINPVTTLKRTLNGLLELAKTPFKLFGATDITSTLSAIQQTISGFTLPTLDGSQFLQAILNPIETAKTGFESFRQMLAGFTLPTLPETLSTWFNTAASSGRLAADAIGKAKQIIVELFGAASKTAGNTLAGWLEAGARAARTLLSPLNSVVSVIQRIRNLASAAINWWGGSKPSAPGGAPKARTIPARAKGGDTPAGDVLVGEKGPEVVNFKQPGTVIPNHKIDRLYGLKAGLLAGSLAAAPMQAAAAPKAPANVNVDISGITISIQGGNANAEELAMQIEQHLGQRLGEHLQSQIGDLNA